MHVGDATGRPTHRWSSAVLLVLIPVAVVLLTLSMQTDQSHGGGGSFRTSNSEIQRLQDAFILRLPFSFIFKRSAFKHSLYHISHLLFLHQTNPASLFCIKLHNSPSFFHHYKCLYQTALQDPPRLRPLWMEDPAASRGTGDRMDIEYGQRCI